MSIISNSVNNIKYVIYNKNDCIQNTLMRGTQWNGEIVNIIKSYISKRKLSHFLNIGSHIGSVCLPISLCIDKVSAIEAYPDTYNHLCENIKLNNISNVNTFNIAIGNEDTDIYFMSTDLICPVQKINRIQNNSGGMTVLTENDIINNIRSGVLSDKKITNKMSKLDNLEIDNFDIILVDIEGLEYDFLLGANEKIKKYKPIIIIELWGNNKRKQENMKETLEDVISYILSLGYKLVQKIGDDYIFEPL